MTPKYCSNCGAKAATPTAKFCASCGTPFAGGIKSLSSIHPTRQLDEEGSDINYVPQIDSLAVSISDENDDSHPEFKAGSTFSFLPDGQSFTKKFKQRRLSL